MKSIPAISSQQLCDAGREALVEKDPPHAT
jgi:hypothetical protein